MPAPLASATLPPVITVDGPSGVGKGLVTRWLAAFTGFHLLDSGALYRILALAAQDRGIALSDLDAVAAIAADLRIEFLGTSEADEQILVDGADLTRRVRTEATGALASQIATAPVVRAALLARQRAFRSAPGLIADGRDMGTVVFADAPLKLFLDASPEERAERRLKQLSRNGISTTIPALLDEILARDARDRNRSVAPLVPADDAHLIDTTGLSPDAVIAQIKPLVLAAALA